MEVLLAAVGTTGDVHPFVGLGRVLRQRGHGVTVFANEHFAPLVGAAGLEFASLGRAAEYRSALDSPDLFGPGSRGMALVLEKMIDPALRPLYEGIAARYRPGKTVVAASSLAFGARIAQDHLGVPLATVHLQPTLLRTVHDVPALPAWFPVAAKRALVPVIDLLSDRWTAGPLNALRAEVGLPPAKRIFSHWLQSPRRVIGMFPEWYGPPQPDWPPQTRLTGFPLYDAAQPEDDPEWLAYLQAGEAPLVFTAGTGMHHAHRFFEASAQACEQLGRRGMLLTRHTAHLPATLPDTVRHFPYLPFSRVLPHCAALIHHGGIGTLSQALASGVPQLLVPLAFDQPDGAARVRRLGVGDSLVPGAYTGASAAEKLGRLIADPAVSARCVAFAERIRQTDPLPETCQLIEALAA